MRQFMFFLLLLTIPLLCHGAESDTLTLPKPKGETAAGSHYIIRTDRIEDGKRLEEQLEHVSNVWDLLFAEWMKDTKITPSQRRLRAVLYKDEQEYMTRLQRMEPAIAQSNGLYDPPRKTAYFFSTEAKIVFHEGTHQILAERFFYDKAPNFSNNFWAVEGIALFMESLKIEEECYKVGDIRANRLYAAMVYRFERNHQLPIRELTAMSAADIQDSKEIQRIYSQSAALTHWLMFAEGGRYRGALFELLRRTYCNEAEPETLSQLTGLSYEELDTKYAEFLKTIPPNDKKHPH